MTDLKDDLAALRIERAAETNGGRRWMVWCVASGLLVAIAAGIWLWLHRERPLEVQAAAVTSRASGVQAAVLNASGYVTARRRATVSSKVTGKVVEVNVEEGMDVREGQVLARLDDTTVRASLALAEAQTEAARRAVTENEVRLTEARLTLGRVEKLLERGLGTPADLDAARATVDSMAARIEALRQQVAVAERQVDFQKTELDNTIVRAPFSGVAISKVAQPGEMVSPVSAGGGFTRTGISTIVDMKSLEVEVEVNESYINRVRPGQAVTSVLDAYPDWQIPSRVITTIPAADRQKATVLVRIAFERLDPRILPDMGVKVTFLREADGDGAAATQPATLVPRSALRTEGDAPVAFVIRGETVERRAVRTGGTDGDRIEVVAGLQPGDRVVLNPPSELTDGARVVVQ
jgi:RND family efflux transporter MFP subunit